MKISKLYTSTLLLSLATLTVGQAQTPQNKKRTVIIEFTDTWCPPCGEYGVPVAESLSHELNTGDKGYLIGVKTSSSPTSLNAAGGNALFSNTGASGVPTFRVANTNDGVTVNSSGDVTRMMSAVTAFNSGATVVSAAANMSISGTVLTVNAKAKFWAAASGDYSMTAFLVEDKISAPQKNYTSQPTIEHLNTLRGAMSTTGTALASSPWGEKIGTATIAANAEFTKVFKVNIDASWKKENLKVYILIFKQNGTSYEYVNAEQAKPSGAPTGIGETVAGVESATLYPNPANAQSMLQVMLTQSMKVSLQVTDVTGRLVYQQNNIALKQGLGSIAIPSQNLSNGTYNVTLTTEDKSRLNRKLVIQK